MCDIVDSNEDYDGDNGGNEDGGDRVSIPLTYVQATADIPLLDTVTVN